MPQISLVSTFITSWLTPHILSVVGFALAIVVLARVLRERRAPGSTLAWLLAIGLVPYIGVPLYLVFGGRKMIRRKRSKQRLYPTPTAGRKEVNAMEKMLRSAGVPPVEQTNRTEMLQTGTEAYEALMGMLRGAVTSIHIESFILANDEVGSAVLDCLTEKASNQVSVLLLLDSLFSFRVDHRRLARLRRAGGKVGYFMPMLHVPFRGHGNLRNHRKVAVVDGRIAMLGGMNLAHEYMGPTEDPQRWRDLSVCFDGPAVTNVEEVFASDWEFATGARVAVHRIEASDGPANTAIQIVASGPDAVTDVLYDLFLTAVFEAKRRIWIATPYFIPDEALTRALVLAVRRGVDVRIVVPARSNHRLADLAGGKYLREIEAAGGHVRPFGPRMLHAKVSIIDDALGIVGSANLDMRSLFLDYEIAALFYSRPEIELLGAWFESTLTSCADRMTPPSALRMLGEDLGRLLAPLV